MRPTKEFITSNGNRVEIKTFMTGREFNEIQSVLFRSAKISLNGGTPQVNTFSGEVTLEANNKAIEQLIVSLDGSIENILQRVLDLNVIDYNEIVAEVNNLTQKKN